MNIETKDDFLTIDDIDCDKEVYIKLEYGNATYINKQQAKQIVEHLTKQFNL